MRSEALDIVIEGHGHSLRLWLAGPFNNEQIPNIREKIGGLIEDGNRILTIDMEQVAAVGDRVPDLFLNLLSLVRGKGGDLILIFRNPAVTTAFATYRNIFQVYPDAAAAARSGILGFLRHRRTLLSRKTGVRISRPVAVFLLVVLAGWFVSLAFIIWLQSNRIRQQQNDQRELTQWKQMADMELQGLRERIRPMEQLGLLRELPAVPPAPPFVRKSMPAVKPVPPPPDSSAPAGDSIPAISPVSGDSSPPPVRDSLP